MKKIIYIILIGLFLTISSPVFADISSIQIVSPNGGETLEVGKTYTITWKSSGELEDGKVTIYLKWLDKEGSLYKDQCLAIGGSEEGCLTGSYITNAIENTGSFRWTVPPQVSTYPYEIPIITGDKYKIEIQTAGLSIDDIIKIRDEGGDTTDRSDNYFTILNNKTKKDRKIKVEFTANGQSESVAVEKGDTVHVSWKSEASEEILGCKGSGSYGDLTMDGEEWTSSSLPTSGNADLKVVNWDTGATSFSVYCWLGDWPQNAEFGVNIDIDHILFLNKNISKVPKGSAPIIANIFPTSGPVGTKVKIVGSGFADKNMISFVGSTNPVSGSNSNTISLINGEYNLKNVNSPDGKSLSFDIPSKMGDFFSEKRGGEVEGPLVIPGIYYFVVQTDSGKSGVSYFKVTNGAEKIDFRAPVTTLLINSNLSFGNLGLEVTKLQSLLAKDQYTYPAGRVTGYYGLLTKQAVERFQCKYGVACSSSDPAYGQVDLKTRFKLDEVFGEGKSIDTGIKNTQIMENKKQQEELQSKINDLLRQIRQLQEQIKSLKK